ncbi:hypothetical protein [Rahnella perminowiae]|uniref:hypothetical protein n=1 Tax=Rahnella perminowiae TaxID=2816244 RepID=UPI00215D1757|nr:hypothetical protein [Rahnella perminowiae]
MKSEVRLSATTLCSHEFIEQGITLAVIGMFYWQSLPWGLRGSSSGVPDIKLKMRGVALMESQNSL